MVREVAIENAKLGMEHFKKQVAKCENFNKEFRKTIKKHEDKIDLLEVYGKQIADITPKDKTVQDKQHQDIEFSRAVIRHQKHKIAENEISTKTFKNQASVYWRHLDKLRKEVKK